MDTEKIIDKIVKLHKLAEKAGSPEEAALAYGRAQEMMTKYAIEEAALALAGQVEREVIVHEFIETGTDRSVQALFSVIAKNNNCFVYRHTSLGASGRAQRKSMAIYGTATDISFVKLMFSSLLLYVQGELLRLRNSNSYMYGGKGFAHSFRLGFSGMVNVRMQTGKARAEATAPGSALVLRDKAKNAEDAARANNSLTKGSKLAKVSDGLGFTMGAKLGEQANVHGHRNNIGTERQAIGQ